MTSRSTHPYGTPSWSPACAPETGRARPLPPDERRAMLIAATLPLVAQHGMKVTTRQIAQAAGVAEGTIFRVFPDKDALISAVVNQALDPTPTMAELLGIDTQLALRERVTKVTAILQRRLTEVFNLLIALRMHGAPKDIGAAQARAQPNNELIHNEIVRLLEPDHDQFRCPVAEVARLLRLLTFTGSHPLISEGQLLSVEQIVSVVLDGTRHHPQPERGDQIADPTAP